jgi:lipopolysaccharide heptosyltransferase II
VTIEITNRSLLVIGHSYIGDALMTTPFIQSLLQAKPKRLDVLAGAPGIEVYARIPGITGAEVRGRRPDDKAPEAQRGGSALAKRLRQAGYDAVFVLKDDLAAAITAWRARIPRRIGFAGEGAGIFLTRAVQKKNAAAHGAARYFALLGQEAPAELYGIFHVSPEEKARARALIAALPQPVIAFAPSTTRAEKDWPLPHCRAFLAMARDAGISVALLGGEQDTPRHDIICRPNIAAEHSEKNNQTKNALSKKGSLLDLTARTSLGETAALIQALPLIVCADSGPMHLAAAVGTQIIALFGQTDPARSGPARNDAVILRSSLPCSPCLKKHCGLNAPCMLSIEACAVFEHVQKVLNQGCRHA